MSNHSTPPPLTSQNQGTQDQRPQVPQKKLRIQHHENFNFNVMNFERVNTLLVNSKIPVRRQETSFGKNRKPRKVTKFNRTVININNTIEDEKKKKIEQERYPWKLKTLNDHSYSGRLEEKDSKYVFLITHSKDWIVVPCDKWYEFKEEGRGVHNIDQVESLMNKSRRAVPLIKESKDEESIPDTLESGNDNIEDEDIFGSSYLGDGDDDGGANDENEWDFEEQVDDDDPNDIPELIDEKDDPEILEEMNENENENEEEKSDEKELKKLLKEHVTGDITYQEGNSFFDTSESEDENSEEETESNENIAATGSMTNLSGTPHGQKRTAEADGQPSEKRVKMEGAPATTDSIREDEVRMFLRTPSTIKEIAAKFQHRIKNNPVARQRLSDILKKIATLSPSDQKFHLNKI